MKTTQYQTLKQRNRQSLNDMDYFVQAEPYINDLQPHFDDLRAQRITLNAYEHICTASILKEGTRVHINRPCMIDGILFETGAPGIVVIAGYEASPTHTNTGRVVQNGLVEVMFDKKDERMHANLNDTWFSTWVVPLYVLTPQGEDGHATS